MKLWRSCAGSHFACLLTGCSSTAHRAKRHAFHALWRRCGCIESSEAVLAVTYDEVSLDAVFFGMSCDEFRHALISSEIVWAPDGDAAFDDGGHVLQLKRARAIKFV